MYEKRLKEAIQQNVLFIMLCQILLVYRWLVLENDIAPAQNTHQRLWQKENLVDVASCG